MHASSMTNMRLCIEKYLTPRLKSGSAGTVRVVDIGSQDVNGSYRSLFDPASWDYLGVDMAPGRGVDLVIDNPYRIPLNDGYADVVISGQMLEHSEYFWLAFAEQVRLVNDDGFIVMIAPSKGPIHRFPVDCYRFYPDAYAGLAKLTNTVLIDCWMDTASEWGDLVGVFAKNPRAGFTRFDTSTIRSPDGPTAGGFLGWLRKRLTPRRSGRNAA